MKKLLLALVLLSLFSAAHSEVYRWEENGKVHFSDVPRKNADKLQLQKLQTFKSKPVRRGRYATPSRTKPNKVPSYELQIKQPSNEQTIRNNAGIVDFTFSVEPRLNAGAGHRIQLSISDTEIENKIVGMRYTGKNIARGSHSVNAKIVDREGKPISPEVSVQFYLHRRSILHPVAK